MSSSAGQDWRLEHAAESQHVASPGSLGNGGWNLLITWAGVFFFNWLKQWGSNQYTKSLQQPFLLLQKTLQVLDPVLSFFQDTLTAIQCHRGGKDCRWFQMIVDFICE